MLSRGRAFGPRFPASTLLHPTRFFALALGIATIATFAFALDSTSEAQQSPPGQALRDRALKNLNVEMPPGPFASWPEESREPALQGLRSRCLFVSGMTFDNFKGPKDALGPAALALVSGCVANAMPSDWPERAAEFKRARLYAEKAKSLMPDLPDLSELAKKIAEVVNKRGR